MTPPLPTDIARALARPDVSARLRLFAGRLSYQRVVSSTNDVAIDLAAAGAPDGTTVLASEQTAGRGRRGRSWYSPNGAGLYLSVVLRDVTSRLVTLLAGVAVAEGIREATGVPVELEWPNDLVVSTAESSRRLKLGGILSEAAVGDHADRAVVVGVGVNVGMTAYPADIVARATSLETQAGRPVDRAEVLVEILASIAAWRERCLTDGGASMLGRWRKLSPSSAGQRVAWMTDQGGREGVTDGIDDDGALRVLSEGRLERLVGGTLTWLPSPDGAAEH